MRDDNAMAMNDDDRKNAEAKQLGWRIDVAPKMRRLRTQTFGIDTLEQGFGSLVRGVAYVQFCLVSSEGEVVGVEQEERLGLGKAGQCPDGGDFFAAMLVPPFRPAADWAESLADNLLHPRFTISVGEAVGRRLRRAGKHRAPSSTE